MSVPTTMTIDDRSVYDRLVDITERVSKLEKAVNQLRGMVFNTKKAKKND